MPTKVIPYTGPLAAAGSEIRTAEMAAAAAALTVVVALIAIPSVTEPVKALALKQHTSHGINVKATLCMLGKQQLDAAAAAKSRVLARRARIRVG